MLLKNSLNCSTLKDLTVQSLRYKFLCKKSNLTYTSLRNFKFSPLDVLFIWSHSNVKIHNLKLECKKSNLESKMSRRDAVFDFIYSKSLFATQNRTQRSKQPVCNAESKSEI